MEALTKWPVRPANTKISLASAQSYQSFRCAPKYSQEGFFMDSEDSGQTGRMPRLIWIFAGRTGHFVGFVMLRLNCALTVIMSVSNCDQVDQGK